jgi:PKHD-type hydroxylase
MQYLLTPYSQFCPPWVTWADCFSDSELDYLQGKAKQAEEDGIVGSNNLNTGVRRSSIGWMYNQPENKFVFEKLAGVVSKLNAEVYRFDLTGFGEPLQLTNYKASNNGAYLWHQDMCAGPSRKLSLVLQLTDPSEYDGGNLQIWKDREPLNVGKQRGLIALFPSFMLHQVSPVTNGSRQSLVAWISGPQFK